MQPLTDSRTTRSVDTRFRIFHALRPERYQQPPDLGRTLPTAPAHMEWVPVILRRLAILRVSVRGGLLFRFRILSSVVSLIITPFLFLQTAD